MRFNNLFAAVVLSSVLLNAADFSLSANGIGPINVHSELTYEGSGVRLVATVKNDSGQSLAYADLCVKPSGRESCWYEMRNKDRVGPGEILTFNVIFADRVPLAHQVTIRDLKLSSVQASPPLSAVAQALPTAPVASPQRAIAPPKQPDSPVTAGALGNFVRGLRKVTQGVESRFDPDIKLSRQTEADRQAEEVRREDEPEREDRYAEAKNQKLDEAEAARKLEEARVLRAEGLTKQNPPAAPPVQPDSQADLAVLRKAADAGDSAAQFSLGRKYADGKGVQQDMAEAIRWLRRAADQGRAEAAANLGLAYYLGIGVPEDYQEAAKWLRRGADQGDADAQGLLALSYTNGQGVPQDYVLAYMWSNLATSNSSGDDRTRYSGVRDAVAAVMTPAQIAEAQTLARNWEQKAAAQAAANPPKR